MSCELYKQQLMEYIDGELSENETKELMEHVDKCPECADSLEEFRKQNIVLNKYYESVSKQAACHSRPQLEERKVEIKKSGTYAFFYSVAAVFAFVMFSGVAMWVYHTQIKGDANVLIGKASDIKGRVQYFDGNKIKDITTGMNISSNMRIKTTQNAYMRVDMQKTGKDSKGNFVEFKGNTSGKFVALGNKNTLNLDHGEIWVHLNEKNRKDFAVQTRKMLIRDQGTIFNVTEGLAGTTVGVVSGSVEFELDGEKTTVEAGNVYSTLGKETTTLAKMCTWSESSEELLAQVNTGSTTTADAGTQAEQLVVTPYTSPQVDTEIIKSQNLVSLDAREFLPEKTRMFFEIANVPSIIEEWNKSAYSKLFIDPALLQWWESAPMAETRTWFEEKLKIPVFLKIFKGISGSLVMGIAEEGNVVLIADCRANNSTVSGLVETQINPMLPEKFDINDTSGLKPLMMKRGYIVFTSTADAMKNTLDAIEGEKPTGFTSLPFYQTLTANVPQSRFTFAIDFKSIIEKEMAKGDTHFNKMMNRSGLAKLDYVLGSPDFQDKGLNHAFRIAFTGEREGLTGWLAEPAPMTSLKFFPPDVHLLAAAKIKKPEVMLADIVRWELEDSNGNVEQFNSDEFLLINDFASCFGNEIAIGLQNPVLPFPNVQVAVEVLDPVKFHDLMIQLIDEFNSKNPEDQQVIMDGTTYRDHLIVTLSSKSWKTKVAYTVLEDYMIIGLGDLFLRRTIDMFEEKTAIIDEYSFREMLPATGQMNFSLLFYQNVTRAIPGALNQFTKMNLSSTEQAMLPNFDIIKDYSSAGISYAFSNDKYIDFYINMSKGVDFNLGGLMPFVASIISNRMIDEADPDDKYQYTMNNLNSVSTAIKAYYVDNNRMPESLDNLTAPVKYISEVPRDFFAETQDTKILYSYDPQALTYKIYSIGPDGKDNLGIKLYDSSKGETSEGDIVLSDSIKQ